MASIADELALLPLFQRVPANQLRSAAPLWSAVSLGVGERLWDQGEAVDQLAVVILGELAAEVDGVEVGRVMPGELLGEASAFFYGNTRSATLVARRDTQVFVLPTPAMRTLRWQRSAVYDTLLDQGLRTLVRRIRTVDQKIACLVTGGQVAPSRAEPSALVRLWKALRPGGPKTACPPLLPILRRQPGLRDAEAEVAHTIAAAFSAEPVEEGQILFLEDDVGAAAWIVAEGGVDVLRHVRGDRAELLAALDLGDVFGINTLVEKGKRTASCVAAAPGWLYRLDADAAAALKGDARMVWRESMLAALAAQIRLANGALNRATSKRAGPKDEFQTLLRASGFLEGLPVDEKELESVTFAISDDDRRNPRGHRLR